MKPAFIILICLAFSIGIFAQRSSSRLRQVPNKSVVQKKASASSISTLVSLFEYVKKSEPDIAKDKVAQTRWLTKSLRGHLSDCYAIEEERMRKNPTDKPEHPNNATFLGVWNQPTTYSIISSRQYDYRNRDNPAAFRTVIDVLYEWGHETSLDNQYPGVRNVRSYIFLFEDGSWKLDDIYGFEDEFTTADSLRQSLRKCY